MYLGVDITRRMDHATGTIEPIAQVLVAFARLRIKLTRRILTGRGIRDRFGRKSRYRTCDHEA